MIRIGILSKQINDLRNFELRIIKHILEDPDLDLSILIFDGRKSNNKFSFFRKIKRHINRGKILSKILLKLQEKLENRLFRINPLKNKEKLIKELGKVDKIFLYPDRKGFLDIFSKKDFDDVSKYDLDLIIRFEFDIIRGNILDASRNGIWSFHHGDNRINRGGPSCFWEIVHKHKSVGVTLQKLTPELDAGYVIDRGTYNIHWSWINTRNRVLESSVSLLIKNLNKLKNNKIKYKESGIYFNTLFKFPGLIFSLKYLILFYLNIISSILKRINVKLFNAKYSYWTIIISKGNFFKSNLNKLKPLILPKKEFWADPFLLNHKKDKYVFFENYEYNKQKGKISCGRIVGNELKDIVDVMTKDYHLSYPSIFNYKDDLFMIPETHQNYRLEIYRCVSFPNDWELYSTAFEGEQIVDCNFFEDSLNNKWLFLNKKSPNTDGCSDLYIYLIDSLSLNKIIPHNENPVITNSLKARNAGPIFKHLGKIYRPSQINSNAIYGRGLNVNEIVHLDIDNYEEKTIQKCLPFFKKNIQGIHHLHQYDGTFVTDICYKSSKLFFYNYRDQ